MTNPGSGMTLTPPTTGTTNLFLTPETFGHTLNNVGNEDSFEKERKQLEHQGLVNAVDSERTQRAGGWLAIDATINCGETPTTPLNVQLATPVTNALNFLNDAKITTRRVTENEVRTTLNEMTNDIKYTLGKVRARVMTTTLAASATDNENLAAFGTELTLQTATRLNLIRRENIDMTVVTATNKAFGRSVLIESGKGTFTHVQPGLLITDINVTTGGGNTNN